MIVLIPFVIIALIAWSIAEYLKNDSVVWRFVYDIAGFASIVFGVILLRTILKTLT